MIFLLALLLLLAPGLARADARGPGRVIDGDTLELAGERLRLFGIDAPELGQSCECGEVPWPRGLDAARRLPELIGEERPFCVGQDRDQHGSIVATCEAGGQDLGAMMVGEGWALADRASSNDYVPQENAARAQGRGLWAGRFVSPWKWREAQAHGEEVGGAYAPGDCRIKGNISRRGKRSYHVPGQAGYDRARIDARRAERWFCTEAEARAAGGRRAER